METVLGFENPYSSLNGINDYWRGSFHTVQDVALGVKTIVSYAEGQPPDPAPPTPVKLLHRLSCKKGTLESGAHTTACPASISIGTGMHFCRFYKNYSRHGWSSALLCTLKDHTRAILSDGHILSSASGIWSGRFGDGVLEIVWCTQTISALGLQAGDGHYQNYWLEQNSCQEVQLHAGMRHLHTCLFCWHARCIETLKCTIDLMEYWISVRQRMIQIYWAVLLSMLMAGGGLCDWNLQGFGNIFYADGLRSGCYRMVAFHGRNGLHVHDGDSTHVSLLGGDGSGLDP